MARWFRVYEDLVDDPKVQRLPPVTFRALINLWCLAAGNDGRLPPVADIAFKLRVTEADTVTLLDELRNAGLLDQDEETGLSPHNWNGRQFKSDVSNDRVKRHRQRRRNVTSDEVETPPEAETDTEPETEQIAALHTVAPREERVSRETVEPDISPVELRLREIAPSVGSRDISPILALIDSGYDLEKHIVPVIRERALKAKKPIGSWQYFVGPVTEAHSANKGLPRAAEPAVPTTWITDENPHWTAMSARHTAERGKPPPRVAGLGGLGWHFPTAWLTEGPTPGTAENSQPRANGEAKPAGPGPEADPWADLEIPAMLRRATA